MRPVLGATLLLLFCLTTNKFPGANACSCLQKPTIETTFDNAYSNVTLKVWVGKPMRPKKDVFQHRWAGNIRAAFQAHNCSVLPALQRQRLEIRTGTSGASCGIEFQERTMYLLVGTLEDMAQKDGRRILYVDSCQYQVPWRTLPRKEKRYLYNQRRCRCTENICGPQSKAPNYQCPDNAETVAGPSDTCRYNPDTKQCTWWQQCPACKEDGDCVVAMGEFCSNGLCRKAGTCQDLRDCFNPSNRYNIQPGDDCKEYSVTCSEQGMCEGVCGCGSCPASACDGTCPCGPVDCFADPCTVQRCNVPGVECVPYYCGGCQAFFYDRAGNARCEE